MIKILKELKKIYSTVYAIKSKDILYRGKVVAISSLIVARGYPVNKEWVTKLSIKVPEILNNTKKEIRQSLLLEHGSLLVMKNGAQIHYKHQIQKATQPKNPRINLTFRKIL
jgi:hypothetical protein